MKKNKIKTLSNGLRILHIPHQGNSVSVEVLVNTGSQYETKKQNGISHFLEHMCFKGTNSHSGKDIMHFLDGLGCRTNAFTDDEVTGYYIKSAKKHWKKTLKIVADIFQNPAFPVDEIEREKGVIVGEINMYQDDPSALAADLFDVTLYGDQPAGWTILGPQENIESMTQQDFMEYHKTHYRANNALVVIAGDIDFKEILMQVEKSFATLESSKIPKKRKTLVLKDGPKVGLVNKETQQSHVVIGYPTVSHSHKDYLILSMLSVLLGGGMSSRLFEKVREELGAGYYIYAHNSNYTDSGSLRIVAGLDSDRVEEVFSHIHGIIVDIQKNGISDVELKKVREYISGNLIMNMESPHARAQYYGYRVLQGRELLSPQQVIRNLKKISTHDIKRVARKYLKESNVSVSLVGPHDNQQAHRILGILSSTKNTS